MGDEHVFVDTNILVYAFDLNAGVRHEQARKLVKGLWNRDRMPAISVQVLQELYVNLVRKGCSATNARERVDAYFAWEVVANDVTILRNAMRIAERYRISLWDAGIVAAARQAGAAIIWSEDLADGQSYEGMKLVNPLSGD